MHRDRTRITIIPFAFLAFLAVVLVWAALATGSPESPKQAPILHPATRATVVVYVPVTVTVTPTPTMEGWMRSATAYEMAPHPVFPTMVPPTDTPGSTATLTPFGMDSSAGGEMMAR